jgi:hypothetical protein
VSVPDAIEPVVGWRCWRVRDSADGFVLESATNATRWPPRFALEAACDDVEGHRPPLPTCRCGIYAARDPGLVVGYFPPAIRPARTIITPAILGYDTVVAVGLVSLWGEVVEAGHGWRGQFAYPKELHVPSAVKHYRRRHGKRFDVFDSSDLAAALSALYDVPASVTRSVRPAELATL